MTPAACRRRPVAADLNQVAGALAQSQAQQAEAQAVELGLRHRLESLTGRPVGDVEVQYEPEPAAAPAEHPALRELAAQSEVARRQVDLPGRRSGPIRN